MHTFPLTQVRLLEGPFLSAEETDLNYMLKLDADRLLSPFLREASLKPKAESYGNWENTGLDGHTAGHYLTALAQMYAATGNLECKRRLDYMVNQLSVCQVKNGNGYVGGVPGGNHMWELLKTGDFNEFNHKWVPWYNLHKLFAGLRDCYLIAGNQQAKSVFVGLADWANNELGSLNTKQIQQMLNTEHGGMDEVCADAYAITGDPKYMLLAQKFCHQALLVPLEHHEDKLNGLHANTQIPKVIGFERIAELTRDTAYSSASRFFWQNVVDDRSVSFGGNSVREHFNPKDNFSSVIESAEGPETCNSNNMLKLSKMLFLADHDPKYINFYERIVYNHILSSQNPISGRFVYFTPIHPEHYRVYSTADKSFWCCVGTGMENHGKYGELIYTHIDNSLYVNLFIPSVLRWAEKGIEVTQRTGFPESEQSDIELKVNNPSRFAVYIRKPDWVVAGMYNIKVNGQVLKTGKELDGYIKIDRMWKTGDHIGISMPMKNTVEQLPDRSAWISFLHGPIVLAAPIDTAQQAGLYDKAGSRWGHIANGPLYALAKSPLLVDDQSDMSTFMKPGNGGYSISDLIYQPEFKQLKLIPFYKIYDTRYMVYWPVAAKDSIKQRQAGLQAMDDHYFKLAARTVDQVSPGEQQPESDHGFSAGQSETGYFRDIHYRKSNEYFSYRMRTAPDVKTLGVTYYGKENGYEFDIFLNETKLTHVIAKSSTDDSFITEEYIIPEDLLKSNKVVTVKFVAAPGKKTAAIYDVRLLR